jgi:hypothetical protein
MWKIKSRPESRVKITRGGSLGKVMEGKRVVTLISADWMYVWNITLSPINMYKSVGHGGSHL